MRKGSTRSVSSLYQGAAEQDLRSMGRAKKTAAQERMDESFGAKPDEPTRDARAARGVSRSRSKRW